jgi:hypothetical protein
MSKQVDRDKLKSKASVHVQKSTVNPSDSRTAFYAEARWREFMEIGYGADGQAAIAAAIERVALTIERTFAKYDEVAS